MADNISLNSMTGGSVVAADNIGNVFYQRMKLTIGADGVNDGDISSANPLPVTCNSVIPGVAAADLGKAEDAVHSSGDTGVMALAVANEANSNFAADGDYVPLGTDREGSMRIIGNRAHDAVDAGPPVKIGHKAVAHGSNPSAVAAGDRVDAPANRHGVPFVIGGHPNPLTKNLQITAADGAQTDTDIIGAIGAGTKYVITWVLIIADKTNSVNPACRIGFGTANTPAADAAGVLFDSTGVPPGGGAMMGNGGGILGVGGDGEELRVTCGVPTGGSLSITVGYYTIES